MPQPIIQHLPQPYNKQFPQQFNQPVPYQYQLDPSHILQSQIQPQQIPQQLFFDQSKESSPLQQQQLMMHQAPTPVPNYSQGPPAPPQFTTRIFTINFSKNIY